jgi:hypothetical protein
MRLRLRWAWCKALLLVIEFSSELHQRALGFEKERDRDVEFSQFQVFKLIDIFGPTIKTGKKIIVLLKI